MTIEFGNVGRLNTSGSGWFIGFGPWIHDEQDACPSLRYMAEDRLARAVQMKWMVHPAGDDRGGGKPPSVGRTLSILVSQTGGFCLEFAPTAAFDAEGVISHRLCSHGDYVLWGADLHHRWFVDSDSTILTVRWAPETSPEQLSS